MARDEAGAGLLDQLTDTHLADRARYGERVGFDELYRRYAGLVAAYATLLTGHPGDTPDLVARAFPDALDAVVAGRSSLDDPFLPSLLRATRELASLAASDGPPDAAGLARHLPPHADLAAVTCLFRHVTTDQRAAVFCTVVAGLDATDLAQALDLTADEAERLLADGREALGDHLSGAVDVLRDLTVPVDAETDRDALASWRTWAQAEPTVHASDDDRTPLIVRLEPAATKILRGAAAAILLVGAAGVVLSSRGGSAHVTGRAIDASPTLGIDGTSSRIDLAAHHGRSGSAIEDIAEAPPGSASPLDPGSLPGLGSGSGRSGIGGSTNTSNRSAAGGNSGTGGGGGTTAGTGGPSGGPGGTGGGSPATPAGPSGGGNGGGSGSGGGGGSGSGGSGGSGGGPVTTPVTAPSNPTPPVTSPPTTAPPVTVPPVTAPASPVTPIITTVTGIVTTVTNPISGIGKH